MSQMPSNAPMMTPRAAPSGLIQTWISALTQPNPATYAAIANAPGASTQSAYLTIFLTSLVNIFVAFMVGVARVLLGGGDRRFGAIAVALICAPPVIAAVGTGLFALFTALVQWIAKMFGGQGSYDKLLLALVAIAAPLQLIGVVFNLLNAIPFVGICFSILFSLIGLYALVLEILAVQGVNQFGIGPAAGSVLIPAFAVALICGCVVAIGSAVLGTAISQVYQNINQSLQGVP